MAESERQQAKQGLERIHRQQVSTDDAANLPEGSWVCRQDGRLFRAANGHSIVSIQSKELLEFDRLSENPYEPDEKLRVMSARVGVSPNF